MILYVAVDRNTAWHTPFYPTNNELFAIHGDTIKSGNMIVMKWVFTEARLAQVINGDMPVDWLLSSFREFIRDIKRTKERELMKSLSSFKLNGDMAQLFNDDQELGLLEEDEDLPF